MEIRLQCWVSHVRLYRWTNKVYISKPITVSAFRNRALFLFEIWARMDMRETGTADEISWVHYGGKFVPHVFRLWSGKWMTINYAILTTYTYIIMGSTKKITQKYEINDVMYLYCRRIVQKNCVSFTLGFLLIFYLLFDVHFFFSPSLSLSLSLPLTFPISLRSWVLHHNKETSGLIFNLISFRIFGARISFIIL